MSSAGPLEPTAEQESPLPWGTAVLVMLVLLPSTMVIPVLRRFVAEGWPAQESLAHAFLGVNLLGACLGGPLLALLADRRALRRPLGLGLAALDGLMALAVALTPPWPFMLLARFIQGAASVGAVSIFMGHARAGARTSQAMGLVASAVVMALVLSIPLGAVLGRISAAMPLLVGGLIGLVVAAVGVVVLPRYADDARSSAGSITALWRSAPNLRLPVLAVGLERLGVGAFVVTLQLHAHHVLGVAERQVSVWFSVFLLIFALGAWPFARLGDRLSRSKLVGAGALVYGLCCASLGAWSSALVGGALALGAVGAAAIYGPALGLAADAVPNESRASAMGLLNAAGTFGMFIGSTCAGLVSSGLMQAGATRGSSYAAVFALAGSVQAAFGLALLLRPASRG